MSEAFTLRMLTAEAYNYSVNEISARISQLDYNAFMNGLDDEALAERFVGDFLLEPLEWDITRPVEYDRDVVIPTSSGVATHGGDPIRRLILPVVRKKSNPRVLTLRPEKRWSQRGPSPATGATYVESDMIIVLRGTKDDLNNMLGTARTLVELINDDVRTYYGNLRPTVLRMIQARRHQLVQEDEAFRREAEQMGVEIRQRNTQPKVVRHPTEAHAQGGPQQNSGQEGTFEAADFATSARDLSSSTSYNNHPTPQDLRGPQTESANEEGLAGRDQPGHNRPHAARQKVELRVFIAYAHSDAKYLERFREHLSPLRREQLLSEWHDRRIMAGKEWEAEINEHLSHADLVILLVSPSFINSEYCYGTEVQHALDRHNRGEAVVIPVIIRPVDWTKTPLGRLQAVPRDGKPITSWAPQDMGWVDAIRQIRRTIGTLAEKRAKIP